MTTLLFIRHAETGLAGYFCGHTDPGLNEQGQAQALQLAAKLDTEPIERLYSSNLRRATETAQVIAQSRGLVVEQRQALREIYFGQWEGRRWEEMEALDPAYAAAWIAQHPNLPAPYGERYDRFTARVLKEVHSIIDQHHTVTAVVTHAGVLRVVLTHLFGCSEREAWAQTKPYCCVVRYACEAIGETK